MKLIIESVVSSILLILITQIIPGVTYSSFWSVLFVFLIFNLVNFFVRPIITILTLPINILTLGIFGFLVNVAIFILCSNLVPGFKVHSFLNLSVILILLSILQPMVRKLSE